MDYKADIRDIKFVAFEMLKIHELANYELFEEATQETLEMIIDEGYKFAKDVLAPTFEIGDREGCKFEGGQITMSKEIVAAFKAFGENGWSGIVENPEYGGQGLPLVTSSLLNEMFTGANCALSLLPMLTVGAAHLLEKYATDYVKEQCLEKMYSLEWGGTMCLTEPQGGSDVGAAKSKAIKLEDGTYRITGTKNFITGGDHNAASNVIHVLLARTEGAPKGTKGLSLFCIPKYRFTEDGSVGEYNDVAAGGIEHKMGIHGTPTCTMNFGENDNCIGYLIGEECAGMRIMFTLMNEARIWVGMQGLALASCAYEQALQYSRERIQGNDLREMRNPDAPRVPIIRHPDVRRNLMLMKAWTEAMRSLFVNVAYMEDTVHVTDDPATKERLQGILDLLTPVCKAYGSDAGFEVTSLGVQVLGGYGYCSEYPLEQLMRDARIAAIYEGANGIQALDLFGRKLTMKGGRLFANYMADIQGFLNDQKENADLADIIESLAAARKLLQQTTVKLSFLARENMLAGVVQATPYLKMFGHVACGFEMAKQAIIAHERLTAIYAEKGADTDEAKAALYETNADINFYQGKLYTVRFFMNNILPDIYGLEKALTSKDTSALDIKFGLNEEEV
jgi:alkylation response protein AidB-like acyl-CoA dehydrogenase